MSPGWRGSQQRAGDRRRQQTKIMRGERASRGRRAGVQLVSITQELGQDAQEIGRAHV